MSNDEIVFSSYEMLNFKIINNLLTYMPLHEMVMFPVGAWQVNAYQDLHDKSILYINFLINKDYCIKHSLFGHIEPYYQLAIVGSALAFTIGGWLNLDEKSIPPDLRFIVICRTEETELTAFCKARELLNLFMIMRESDNFSPGDAIGMFEFGPVVYY